MLDKLEDINIKELSDDELKRLAKCIRKILIDTVSKNGGHLASNLGIVELTLALFKVFDFNVDDVVFDVGHQSYVYKLFTGRAGDFDNIRKFGHISGFPSIEESKFDSFGTGHASTSIAAASGIAKAKYLSGDRSNTIAIIGDGSLTGGIALESLNNLVDSNNKLIIIINDNDMSIDENIGVTNYHLSRIRLSSPYNKFKNSVFKGLGKIPNVGSEIYEGIKKAKDSVKVFFMDNHNINNFGIKYYGPINGHDIGEVVSVLEKLKDIDRPTILHIKTVKGKGYKPAILEPSKFHGIGPFDKKTGEVLSPKGITYTQIFEEKLLKLAIKHSDIIAISAAMVSSTGLSKMKKFYKDRVIDVGIAEEYAVIYAAGLAKKGYKPVVAIYSTFLQRAYDQILHDVCLQNLHVIFAIDRAGIVGNDGATHQGLFDLSYLSSIPNMTIIAPANARELEDSLDFAYRFNGPIAIRYPKSNADLNDISNYSDISIGKSVLVKADGHYAIFAVGTMLNVAIEVSSMLKEKGIDIKVINARFVKPIDTDIIDMVARECKYIFTLEENVINGGYGQKVATYVQEKFDTKVTCIGIEDEFVSHGTIEEIKRVYKLDKESIYKILMEKISNEEKKTG